MEKAAVMLTGAELGLPFVRRLACESQRWATRVPWHCHDCIELLFATDGATVYEFEDEAPVDFTGGNFLVIPGGVVHRGLQDVRRPTSMVGIMFDMSCMPPTQGTSFADADVAWMGEQFASTQRRTYAMNGLIRSLAKIVAVSLSTTELKSTDDQAMLRWATCGIVLEAARQVASVRIAVPKRTSHLAIEYMQANMGEPTSIDHVARAVGCSRATLFDVFKATTGMTPNDYWLRLRIDQSQKLLVDESITITEIGLRCGFSTSQYFCNVFRKYANMSPSEYRRLFRKNTQQSQPHAGASASVTQQSITS